MHILENVEHFRTSYNQKDLKYLRNIFSDKALIITGSAMTVGKTEVSANSNVKWKFSVQSKAQYLSNLEKAFKRNSYIKVVFDDIKIVEHPTIRNVFGVTVKQKWNSSTYSDEGIVFMVWDFRKEYPQIHVRTWQPEFMDKKKTKRISDEDVFTLSDFDM